MSNPAKKKRDEPKSDEIFQAPVIVREPMSRQVQLGGRLTLRVTATGKPLPTFQWYLNGKKISGANSDRLMVNKTRRDNIGAYSCEAKNFVGKVMSRAAMVSFLAESVPDLVVEPAVASVPAGKPFRFRIAQPGPDKLKKLSFQWTFNGKRIVGAKGPELQFTEVKKKYEGEYKVVLFVGGELRASNTVKLMVLAAEAQGMEMPSRIDIRRPEPAELAPAATAAEATAPDDGFFNPEEEELAEEGLVLVTESSISLETAPADTEIVSEEPALDLVSIAAQPSPATPEPLTATAPRAMGSLALQRKKRTLEKLLSHWRDLRGSANRNAA